MVEEVPILLVSSSYSVNFHRTPHYEPAHTHFPRRPNTEVRDLSWSPDASTLAFSYGDCADIVHTRNNKFYHVKTLDETLLKEPLTSCSFMKTDNRLLALGLENGTVALWDCQANKTSKVFTGGSQPVGFVCPSLDDTLIATGSVNGLISLFATVTNTKSSKLQIPQSKTLAAIRFSPLKRAWLGACSDEGSFAVWDVNSSKVIYSQIKAHSAPCIDIVFSNINTSFIGTAGFDNTVIMHDTGSQSPVYTIKIDESIRSVDMHPDGMVLAIGSGKGSIYVYDLRQMQTALHKLGPHSSRVTKLRYQVKSKKIVNHWCFDAVAETDADSPVIDLGQNVNFVRGSSRCSEAPSLSSGTAGSGNISQEKTNLSNGVYNDSFLAEFGLKQGNGLLPTETLSSGSYHDSFLDGLKLSATAAERAPAEVHSLLDSNSNPATSSRGEVASDGGGNLSEVFITRSHSNGVKLSPRNSEKAVHSPAHSTAPLSGYQSNGMGDQSSLLLSSGEWFKLPGAIGTSIFKNKHIEQWLQTGTSSEASSSLNSLQLESNTHKTSTNLKHIDENKSLKQDSIKLENSPSIGNPKSSTPIGSDSHKSMGPEMVSDCIHMAWDGDESNKNLTAALESPATTSQTVHHKKLFENCQAEASAEFDGHQERSPKGVRSVGTVTDIPNVEDDAYRFALWSLQRHVTQRIDSVLAQCVWSQILSEDKLFGVQARTDKLEGHLASLCSAVCELKQEVQNLTSIILPASHSK